MVAALCAGTQQLLEAAEARAELAEQLLAEAQDQLQVQPS